jgi:hypothetical protein
VRFRPSPQASDEFPESAMYLGNEGRLSYRLHGNDSRRLDSLLPPTCLRGRRRSFADSRWHRLGELGVRWTLGQLRRTAFRQVFFSHLCEAACRSLSFVSSRSKNRPALAVAGRCECFEFGERERDSRLESGRRRHDREYPVAPSPLVRTDFDHQPAPVVPCCLEHARDPDA